MSDNLEIEVNGEDYYITRGGDVLDGGDTLQVTANQLERIYETAQKVRAALKGQVNRVSGDHCVQFLTDENGNLEPGDVMIGCQHVVFREIVLAVKASPKQRAKKGRK